MTLAAIHAKYKSENEVTVGGGGSNQSLVTVGSVSGNSVTVIGVAEGTATIRITATDRQLGLHQRRRHVQREESRKAWVGADRADFCRQSL